KQENPGPREGRQGGKPARDRLGLMGGGVLAITVILALLVGLQLGGLRFRMRRDFLRLQGALVGGLVGVLVGYVVGRTSSEPPA
ncbi:MAG: hypothetical protein ACRC1L_12500, partial [Prochlorococcaceae cyanobacterium]